MPHSNQKQARPKAKQSHILFSMGDYPRSGLTQGETSLLGTEIAQKACLVRILAHVPKEQ